MNLVIHEDSIIDHDALLNFEANEHIDWTDTDEDLLTIGTLGAGAITGTSFIIGANTLDTNEFAFLDGQDQSVLIASSPTFNDITISTPSNIYALSHDNFADFIADEHINVKNSFTQNDAQYIATDEIRARDGDGLKLHDDDGNGIFVKDGGNVGINEIAPETLLEMSSTAPYLTLHNSTAEDTEGGREGKIIFKGEQSGGEETTLAIIQASHDGVGDDQKGDLIFYTNDGTDGDTPTEAVRIDSAGLVTILRNNLNVGEDDVADRILNVYSDTAGSYISIRSQGNAAGWYTYGTSMNFAAATASKNIVFYAGGLTAGDLAMTINHFGNVGIGDSTPAARVEILTDTFIQLQLSHDTTNHITFVVQSDGDLTIDSNKASYDLDFGDGNLITTGALGAGLATTASHYPSADDTYYLGKNDDDAPAAWKGLILKDQTDDKYYRIELNNGAISIVDLTD